MVSRRIRGLHAAHTLRTHVRPVRDVKEVGYGSEEEWCVDVWEQHGEGRSSHPVELYVVVYVSHEHGKGASGRFSS